MPFSNGHKALIKNAYQFQKYNYCRILSKFSKIKCKRYLVAKKIGKQEALAKGMRLAE